MLSKEATEFIKGREVRRATVRKIRHKAQAAMVYYSKKEFIHHLIIEAIKEKFQSKDGKRFQFQSQCSSLPKSFESCLLDGNATIEKLESLLEANSLNSEYSTKIMKWLNDNEAMEDNRHDYHHDHDVNAVQDTTDKTKTIDQSKLSCLGSSSTSISKVSGLGCSLTPISDLSYISPKKEYSLNTSNSTKLSLESISVSKHSSNEEEDPPNSTSLWKLPSYKSVPELFSCDDKDPSDLSQSMTSASMLSLGCSLTSVSELSLCSSMTSLSKLSLWSSLTCVSELSYYSSLSDDEEGNLPDDLTSVLKAPFLSSNEDEDATILSHESKDSTGVRMSAVCSPPDKARITDTKDMNSFTILQHKSLNGDTVASMKASNSLTDLNKKRQICCLKSRTSCSSSGYSSFCSNCSFPMESLKLTPPSTLFSKEPQKSQQFPSPQVNILSNVFRPLSAEELFSEDLPLMQSILTSCDGHILAFLSGTPLECSQNKRSSWLNKAVMTSTILRERSTTHLPVGTSSSKNINLVHPTSQQIPITSPIFIKESSINKTHIFPSSNNEPATDITKLPQAAESHFCEPIMPSSPIQIYNEVAGDKKRKKGNKRFKRFCAALRSSFMHFSIPTLHIISY